MVSGDPSALYDELLGDWRHLALQVMNQAGVRTEKPWFNFAPERLFWARFAGKHFTDRQRIKRKAESWAKRYQAMPPAERLAVLAGLMALEAEDPQCGFRTTTMASVNKASLREEFDTLKGAFERLCANGKMTEDSRALFQALLVLFELLMAVFMEKRTAKNSRVAKSDAHNLWERLKRHEETVLLFARLPHVPFTNNRAERDPRMSKVKQKISGWFRTRQYAEAYCRISSYLQTLAYRGYNPLVAIQMALSGQIYSETGE
jgi:hypothetical protein